MAGILIVDDDPTIRAMFARALKGLGDIDQAGNGVEALRLLSTKKYGVVLLDLHMPIVDGFVLLHTLANKPGQNRETPIYVITADTSDQARIRALQRRAVFLLTKPVPIATLTALVDSTLKKAAARAAGAPDTESDEADVDSLLGATSGPPSSRSARSAPPTTARPAALARTAATLARGGGVPDSGRGPLPTRPATPKKPGG